ncbi:cytochrome P450 monooxygenase pc-3 [Clavulina sp. PMI_390]|nr:cytochrome P450 monooxygenase pc-3 [Clavulina sp. PMI_390]
MPLPPGIVYLLSVLPKLAAPPLLVYAVSLRYDEAGASTIPSSSGWLRLLLVVLATPATVYALALWKSLSYRLQARRLGAEMLPQVRGKWYIPADMDLLVHLISAVKWDYTCNQLGELMRINGKTIMLRVAGDRKGAASKILTKEPRHIKRILAGNFENYVKGEELFGQATRPVLGVGVFNSDGAMWKFHRTLARPFFARDRISDFEIFEKHAESIIEIMKASFRSGTPLDIQDIFSRFTLDSTSEFLFGECVNSIHEPLLLPGGIQPDTSPQLPSTSHTRPSSATFVKALAAAQHHISTRVFMGRIWPLSEMFRDKSEDYTPTITAYLEPIVEKAMLKKAQALREKDGKHMENNGSEKAAIEEDMTLLDYLVLQTDDRAIIRDSLMNMLVAGRDTTACLLTFATYLLSQHPDVLAKLRAEILDIIGPTTPPTSGTLRELKYLRAVLNETLRLFPPVPLDYRETIEADVWTDDGGKRWFIPAGTETCYSVMHMQRDKDLWGEDALMFDPMRWIDERLSKLTANPFIFLPFNAGPRICLGQQFAYNEASFLLVRLLQTFGTITLRPDAQPHGTVANFLGKWDLKAGRNGIEKVWPRSHLIMYVEGGMWGVMEPGPNVSV